MPRTYDDSPIVKMVKRLIEAQTKDNDQRRADMMGFVDGATSQLMTMVGSQMSVQAAMLEWLDKTFGKPGLNPSDQIQGIVQQNIARHKAERAAREEAEAAQKAALASLPDASLTSELEEVCRTCGSHSPEKCNQPCTDKPASAYRSVDDPALYVTPADIVPAAPADAPADPSGST